MARFEKRDASPVDGPDVHTRSRWTIILDDADRAAILARRPVSVRVILPPNTPIHEDNEFTIEARPK